MSIAVVIQGEAIWGAFSHGALNQLTQHLQAAGHDETPYQLAVGSSTGSLLAAIASLPPHAHEETRAAWMALGRAGTGVRSLGRRLLQRNFSNPHEAALQYIIEHQLPSGRQLVNINDVLTSDTLSVIVTSDFELTQFLDATEAAFNLVEHGLHRFLKSDETLSPERMSHLLHTSANLFAPRYFATGPWPVTHADDEPEQWQIMRDEAEVRTAIAGSTRIPLFFGGPVGLGNSRLFDGAFADNVPVELALRYGAEDVFIITSSHRGNIYERPAQSMLQRQIRNALGVSGALADFLTSSERTRGLGERLGHLGELWNEIPKPRPLDLDALRSAYPNQRIHVIHPPRNTPGVMRFGEWRPEIIGELYDLGTQATDLHEDAIISTSY